jgi:hypothetical protein
MTDQAALDAIAHVLSDPEWDSGMLEDIAEYVRATGRSTETRYDRHGDPIDTWDRH